MQVAAVSTPGRPEWRWRIANYAGEIIEESRHGFGTITAALAEGTKRLTAMKVVDKSEPPRTQWTSRRDR